MTVTATAASTSGTFVTVPGDRHSEVARTLALPAGAIGFGILAVRELDQSFAVAAVATLLVGGLTSLKRSRGRPAPAGEELVTAA